MNTPDALRVLIDFINQHQIPDGDIVAAHVSRHAPAPATLHLRAPAWGRLAGPAARSADVHTDGSVLHVATIRGDVRLIAVLDAADATDCALVGYQPARRAS